MHTGAAATLFIVIAWAVNADGLLWDSFSVTYPAMGRNHGRRYPLPRTAQQAYFEDGWRPILRNLRCENIFLNGFHYRGYAFSHPNDTSLAILYDPNGVVAGMQLWMPEQEVLRGDWAYRYDLSPMFQNVTINREDYIVITVYFVHPAKICSEPRNDPGLIAEGTAEGIWFQTGKTPKSLHYVSKTGVIEKEWVRDSCVPGQGHRYFYKLDEWQDYRCDNIPPHFLLTDGFTKDIVGFGLIVPGRTPRSLDGDYVDFAQELGPRRGPECWNALVDAGEVTVWQVLFVAKSWLLVCPNRNLQYRDNFYDSRMYPDQFKY